MQTLIDWICISLCTICRVISSGCTPDCLAKTVLIDIQLVSVLIASKLILPPSLTMHLQFESWSACTISNLFWKRLAEVKVDELGSGRCRRRIWAFYQLGGSSALLSLHLTAESLQPEQPSRVAELGKNFFCLPGELQLADSIEEFKALDRHAEATRIAQENRQVDLKSGFLPNFFVLFAFADVKRYRFYHQIAYPVLLLSAPFLVVGSIESWQQSQSSNEPAQCTAASVIVDNDLVSIADPCNGRTACWPLRQVLTNQSFAGRTIRIQARDRTFTVAVPSMQDGNSDTGITGWERSREDPRRIAPVKCTDLSSLFDPCQLAKQAAELNLKLMKWRLVPQLDLSRLSRTTCLLIGSGTLGCNIARVLTVSTISCLFVCLCAAHF